jgi:ascorbate-specific PTS system EIIC-type component UlaA
MLRFNTPTSFNSETSVAYWGTTFDGIMQIKKNAANNWDFSLGHRRGRLLTLFPAYDPSAFFTPDSIGIFWNQEGGAKKLISVDWIDFT